MIGRGLVPADLAIVAGSLTQDRQAVLVDQADRTVMEGNKINLWGMREDKEKVALPTVEDKVQVPGQSSR